MEQRVNASEDCSMKMAKYSIVLKLEHMYSRSVPTIEAPIYLKNYFQGYQLATDQFSFSQGVTLYGDGDFGHSHL